jgi:hypothetical protein
MGGIQTGVQGTLCSRRGFTDKAGGVHTFKARGRLSNAISQQVQSSLPIRCRSSGHGFEKEKFLYERFE